MKRNNLLIFCLISVLSFAGCSNGDSQSSESKSESISTSESSAVSDSSDIEDSSFIQKYKARRKINIPKKTLITMEKRKQIFIQTKPIEQIIGICANGGRHITLKMPNIKKTAVAIHMKTNPVIWPLIHQRDY